MAYLALARKWRPQKFEEVKGQEHITLSLKNALSSGRTTHAYLFSGPIGTGKTTTARILAKALNCQGEDPSRRPCNECNPCLEITRGSCLDVLEIDGASNRGIDEIRELRERIKFAPVNLRRKVYIIDEVHMLTEPAFNALLKTLEEPPSYVVFVFATTNPHKVPLTILSRCQRFDFKRISNQNIIQVLEAIVKEENITIDSSALNLISQAATGSLRDAQTILDQLISYKRTNIKREDVLFLLGRASFEDLVNLSKAISNQDKVSCLNQVKEVYYNGLDLEQLVFDLLKFYKDLYFIKISPSLSEVLEVSEKELDILTEQSQNYSLDYLRNIIEYLKKLPSNFKETNHSKLILELGIMDLIELRNKVPIAQILNRLEEIAERYKDYKKDYKVGESTFSLEKDYHDLSSSDEISSLDIIPSLNLNEVKKGWNLLLERVKKKKASLKACLSEGEILEVNNEAIVLGFQESFSSKIVEKKENIEIIEEEIRSVFDQELKLKIAIQRKSSIKKEDSSDLNYSLLLDNEPVVKEALEVFGGQIIKVKE